MSMRPPSSLSTRPSSVASTRPSSSASSARPPTSMSSRPGSRMTQRASSRFSLRPTTRQSTRLNPLYQDLITDLTGISPENDEENFQIALDFVAKNLDQTVKPSGSADIGRIDKHIRGLIQKARIISEDTYATALDTAQTRVKIHFKNQPSDLDAEFNTSRLPFHLLFMLSLSSPPNSETMDYAESYMDRIRYPPQPSRGLTWEAILAEEPLEGQHWEGVYGLPPGSTVEGWETRSEPSTPSLSPLLDGDNFDDLDDSFSSLGSGDQMNPLENETRAPVYSEFQDDEHELPPGYNFRDVVENLQSRQYWRPEWKNPDANTDRPFNIGDPSMLGPSFRRVLAEQVALPSGDLIQPKYIDEHDVIREVLMGLQGRTNIMISSLQSDRPLQFTPSTKAPSVLHFSEDGLYSILASFATTATTVEHLRKFVSAVFHKASHAPIHHNQPSHLAYLQRRSTRTLEAFCEAVDSQVRRFDAWCSSHEEAIVAAQAGIGSPLPVSLLNLEKSIRDTFSEIFAVLLTIIRQVVQRATRSPEPLIEIWTFPDLPSRMAPAALTALLLNSLLSAARESSSMGDEITSAALVSVISHSAEPIWAMIGRWLKDGMPIRDVAGPLDHTKMRIDEEFFIEDNELALLDPDFWADGFVLRDGDGYSGDSEEVPGRPTAVPMFLQHSAEHVLSAGKSIGLLRALGLSSVCEEGGKWLDEWLSFKTLLHRASQVTLHMSIDDFSRVVYDELLVSCQKAQAMLTNVLVDECDLWLHLSAMEDLFLMRKGDTMSNLVDVLFARMDSPLSWTDFHFLNTAFRDVIEGSPQKWIDPSLVRFSYRGGKDKHISRTIRAIDGLLIEYAVPFPLTYIFGPKTMQAYSSIFGLVLQIRRAKSALEKILVRSIIEKIPQLRTNLGSDLKMFYAMRGKLSWFVNALLNFICTNVLHTQVLAFHEALKEAKSLDDMISMHEIHLDKLEGRCLLQKNTLALHRAVLSILDMTLYFSDCFVAFAGTDTTHDISRQSLITGGFNQHSRSRRHHHHPHHHRSRRLRKQRKNIIGFSQSQEEQHQHHREMFSSDSSSSESEDEDFEETEKSFEGPGPSFSFGGTSSISFAEEGFSERLDKMSSELDGLVRFIRRGVESLAAGTSEAASAFGIFAFALEDWDR
ncbi:Spc98 family-domain-containing protein [Abortiporus biennis]|nr:Spc98 family-domain-containing protein [Abortiporus biennis]